MVMSEKEFQHNLVNISWNSFKNYPGHLNINPKQYAKYRNPSSSCSPDSILTRFFNCYNRIKSKKGHNFAKLVPTEKICIRLNFVLMRHIKFKVPSSSGSLTNQQKA